MESSNCLKDFFKYASFNVLGMLGLSCYILADTFFVSKGLGTNGLTALNLAIPFYSFIHGSGLMIGMGGGTKYSIQKSQGAHQQANRTFTNAVFLAACFAVVFILIGIFLAGPVIGLFTSDRDVFAMSETYLRVIMLFAPAFLMNNVLLCFVRNDGAPQLSMAAMIGGSLSNVVLDYLFIFPLGLGIFGAALATVISQAVAGVWSLLYMVKNFRELGWSKEEGRLSLSHCASLCMMGLPMGLQCSITAVGNIVLQAAVNGLGSAAVAAMTAGSKAGQILSVPLESIGTAMTTYTSQNLGAGSLPRVRQGVRTALEIGILYSIASFIIFHFSDKLVIGMFLDSSEDVGGTIMANAQEFLFWNSVFYIPLAVLIVYRYSIQGLGYSGLAMFAGVFEMFARALVGFWMVPVWGYWAGCIASPVAWFAACFFLIPAYYMVMHRLEGRRNGPKAASRPEPRLRKA